MIKTKTISSYWIVVFVFLFITHTGCHSKTKISVTDTLQSPRLRSLSAAISSGDKNAVENFWKEMMGKTPLEEDIRGDDKYKLVTFLYRSKNDMSGLVLAGPVPPHVRQQKLIRLGDSDIWWLTVQLPAASRFSYFFLLNNKKYIDALNPHRYGPDNMTEMKNAVAQYWNIEQPNSPKGSLEEFQVNSELLKEDRTITVYTPPNYTATKKYGLLVVLDGEDHRQVVPLPLILDNLIAHKKIEPLVAVLVHNKSQQARMTELACSPVFADFLAKELVQWAQKKYTLQNDPAETIITGGSLGGLMAAYTAFRHSQVFGNVLSQSGSFWYYPGWVLGKERLTDEFGWLTRQFVASPKLPVKFFIEVGLFETPQLTNQLLENRHLRDVLLSKNYEVTYSEYAGGHENLDWQGSLGEGLIALMGNKKR